MLACMHCSSSPSLLHSHCYTVSCHAIFRVQGSTIHSPHHSTTLPPPHCLYYTVSATLSLTTPASKGFDSIPQQLAISATQLLLCCLLPRHLPSSGFRNSESASLHYAIHHHTVSAMPSLLHCFCYTISAMPSPPHHLCYTASATLPLLRCLRYTVSATLPLLRRPAMLPLLRRLCYTISATLSLLCHI